MKKSNIQHQKAEEIETLIAHSKLDKATQDLSSRLTTCSHSDVYDKKPKSDWRLSLKFAILSILRDLLKKKHPNRS